MVAGVGIEPTTRGFSEWPEADPENLPKPIQTLRRDGCRRGSR